MIIGDIGGKTPTYSDKIIYNIDDSCMRNGILYVALVDNAGDPLLNTTNWSIYQKVPSGGNESSVIVKQSSNDYDIEWKNIDEILFTNNYLN